MNLSMQVGRGLVALTLCVAVSAYAVTHPVTPAPAPTIPTLAAISVTATQVAITKQHAVHKNERCETSVVVGVPIGLGEKKTSR